MHHRRSLLCAIGLVAVPAYAVDLPSTEAQAKMLDLMESRALHRDAVDWKAVRAGLDQAKDDPARLRVLLDAVIQRSSNGHGRWLSPGRVSAGPTPRSPAMISQGGTAVPAALDRRLGWVAVERYADVLSAPPEDQFR